MEKDPNVLFISIHRYDEGKKVYINIFYNLGIFFPGTGHLESSGIEEG